MTAYKYNIDATNKIYSTPFQIKQFKLINTTPNTIYVNLGSAIPTPNKYDYYVQAKSTFISPEIFGNVISTYVSNVLPSEGLAELELSSIYKEEAKSLVNQSYQFVSLPGYPYSITANNGYSYVLPNISIDNFQFVLFKVVPSVLGDEDCPCYGLIPFSNGGMYKIYGRRGGIHSIPYFGNSLNPLTPVLRAFGNWFFSGNYSLFTIDAYVNDISVDVDIPDEVGIGLIAGSGQMKNFPFIYPGGMLTVGINPVFGMTAVTTRVSCYYTDDQGQAIRPIFSYTITKTLGIAPISANVLTKFIPTGIIGGLLVNIECVSITGASTCEYVCHFNTLGN